MGYARFFYKPVANNTARGYLALINSTGAGNTAIGFRALDSNKTGYSNNVAVGNNALFLGSEKSNLWRWVIQRCLIIKTEPKKYSSRLQGRL